MPGHLCCTDALLSSIDMVDKTFTPAIIQLFLPFLILVVNIISQVLGCRYITQISLLKSAFFGYGVGLIFLIVFEINFLQFYTLRDFFAILTANFAIYSMFSYWYFIFITLAETAIRTRLLIEIESSAGGLSEKQILAKYNTRELIERRINRLVGNGQIINKAGRFYCGQSPLVLFGKFSSLMHKLVPGEKREA
jgi:hypothetical protein